MSRRQTGGGGVSGGGGAATPHFIAGMPPHLVGLPPPTGGSGTAAGSLRGGVGSGARFGGSLPCGALAAPVLPMQEEGYVFELMHEEAVARGGCGKVWKVCGISVGCEDFPPGLRV